MKNCLIPGAADGDGDRRQEELHSVDLRSGDLRRGHPRAEKGPVWQQQPGEGLTKVSFYLFFELWS